MFACGQHGDHRVHIGDCFRSTCRDFKAVGLCLFQMLRQKIEAAHRMTCLDQIGGHWASHIAEADKCDCGHDKTSLAFSSRSNGQSCDGR
ncbi:hypothetical protein C086_01240 [Brucella abortus F6/05-3]|nr:hypothetical protein DK51_169 [Brucella abortus]ENP35314.1 hypothetical protein C088_01208 [Brucella abortus 65/110]ENQ04119.1 hypothetical protein C031_01203 [Brucella abortus F6/05-2]ENR86066.1 hypothetical protein B996_00997 [Brucella abortus 78/14]ENR97241.1 hypothetical protein B973_00996 [Brucella abortus 80/28]ENS05562.1 hypothetical protein B974_00996 [Brucella abortus 87/28]ENS13991.1 hypothetical protein B995_00996 [Brucella abortus F1/06-B21]ENS25748.1 hypothetical protein C086